jgi:hypothetical protein
MKGLAWSISLVLLLLSSAAVQAAPSPFPPVVIDVEGQAISRMGYLVPPGRVLIPLRSFSESLGAQVDYEASSRTPIVIGGETIIRTPLDSMTAYVNGSRYKLDASAALLTPGTSFVPLRFIAENLGVRSDDLLYHDHGADVRHVHILRAPRFAGSAYRPDSEVVWAAPTDVLFHTGLWSVAAASDPYRPGLGDPGYEPPTDSPSPPTCIPGRICPNLLPPPMEPVPEILPMHGRTLFGFSPRVMAVARETDKTKFAKRERLVDASCASPSNRHPDEVVLTDKTSVKNTWKGEIEFPIKVVEVKLGFSLEKGKEYSKSTKVQIDPGWRVEYWQQDLYRPIYVDVEYRYFNLARFYPHIDAIVRRFTVYQFLGNRTHSTKTVRWSQADCPTGTGG